MEAATCLIQARGPIGDQNYSCLRFRSQGQPCSLILGQEPHFLCFKARGLFEPASTFKQIGEHCKLFPPNQGKSNLGTNFSLLNLRFISTPKLCHGQSVVSLSPVDFSLRTTEAEGCLESKGYICNPVANYLPGCMDQ